MTDSPLAASGDDREVFLRALREYSDSCGAPNLTAGCPFALDTAAGGRVCEEQCLDLLGRNRAPAAKDEIDLGAGFSMFRRRRPRPRASHNEKTRPFDARAIWLADKDQQLEHRHTVSLVFGLRDDLTDIPSSDEAARDERYRRIKRSIEILEERGLTFDPCLKPQMVGRVVIAIASLLLFAPRRNGERDTVETLDSASRESVLARFVDDWAPILEDMGITVGEAPQDRESVIERAGHMGRLLPRLATWGAVADFDDVIAWRPPTGALPDPDPLVVEQVSPKGDRWIVDRFLETYLDDWSTTSLHQEWKWAHGETTCPIPASEMKLRHVDESSLSKLIADRAAHQTDAADSLQMDTFQRVARDLLDSGSREAAAALFEAVVVEAPENAEALNNLGFCLIQDDLGRALDTLESARVLGYQPAVVNLANRALCLIKLERYGPATALIDEGYLLAGDTPRQAAWLWALDSGTSAEIVYVDNLADYMAHLGLAAAEASGDEERSRSWTTILENTREAR